MFLGQRLPSAEPLSPSAGRCYSLWTLEAQFQKPGVIKSGIRFNQGQIARIGGIGDDEFLREERKLGMPLGRIAENAGVPLRFRTAADFKGSRIP